MSLPPSTLSHPIERLKALLQRRPPGGTRQAATHWAVAARLLRPLADLGRFGHFALLTLMAMPAVPFRKSTRRELIAQIDIIGVGGLPVTHVTGFVAGLLLGLQTRVSLKQFGLTSLFAQMLTIALVREVGPAFVALVAGARAGSGVTSELATMAVTQQVDAMRALRTDPIHALAAPRTLASLISFPVLSIAGVLAGFFGGMLVGKAYLGQGMSYFFHQAALVLGPREFIPNLVIKPAVFGLLIGLIASYLGMRAEGGTRAVGIATVRSVVMVTVGVLIADYLVGEMFRELWPPPPF